MEEIEKTPLLRKIREIREEIISLTEHRPPPIDKRHQGPPTELMK